MYQRPLSLVSFGHKTAILRGQIWPTHQSDVVGLMRVAGQTPAHRHRAISKLARKTNHIERFNITLCQRVARLVRSALSFSKKLAPHVGALKLIICHYNLMRAAM